MLGIHRSRRVAHAILPFSLVAALALPGCKKPAKPGDAPAASGSAGVAAGPCADYSKRICDKAGAQSQTCQALGVTADILSPATCTAALKDVDYSFKKIAADAKVCDDLTKTLCDSIGPTTQTCQMVTSQTKGFTPDRCKAMKDHMPEVLAQLKKMEEANKPLSPEQQQAMLADPGANFGPPTAAVQIVEFSDFQCPYCSRAAEAVHKIKEKYGDRVHFTFRQFPLPMHPNARGAAEAALAANAQGKFWQFHDLLFKNQQALDSAGLEAKAKEAGLNVAEFKKSLSDHQFAPKVDADVKLGEGVAVQGTPTMFINGARVADPTSYDAIAAQIETALKGGARSG
ncbi:MAG TPA: thioredoxin domain-containing protein [Polyangiaceae bacterium]|jgi:protein-disulfide isomerase|nr:thioredoxin domain-containing protein [Polyangiaceae bacterium]